ncbi:hypothetical protein [Mucilaginibacter sp.]|uniref:hypothetical protein n=1 Tax=Mucilaginibacter sp. TaxID=1882438 RepID=UPI00326458F6
MEKKLNHKPTPQKNKNRDQHKQTLTAIWQRTTTSGEFISEAKACGYQIAGGTDRPFKVIDEDGVSFDLVRKLDGVKTAEVRTRFGKTELPQEKQAIREMQSAKQERKREPPQDNDKIIGNDVAEETKDAKKNVPAAETVVPCQAESSGGTSEKTTAQDTAQTQARQKFLQNVKDVRERNRSLTREITLSLLIAAKICFSFKGNATEQRAALKQQFVADMYAITTMPRQKPPDKMLGFLEAAQYYKPT